MFFWETFCCHICRRFKLQKLGVVKHRGLENWESDGGPGNRLAKPGDNI